MANTHALSRLRMLIFDTAETVFTDAELTSILATNVIDIDREELRPSTTKLKWFSRHQFLDTDITLYDSMSQSANELTPTTPTTAQCLNGEVSFSSDPERSVYLDGISYDPYGAAAECLLMLMNDPNRLNSWSRGGVSVNHYNLAILRREMLAKARHKIARIDRQYRSR